MYNRVLFFLFLFFLQAEDGIRAYKVTGVQTCALPILSGGACGTGISGRRRDGASVPTDSHSRCVITGSCPGHPMACFVNLPRPAAATSTSSAFGTAA